MGGGPKLFDTPPPAPLFQKQTEQFKGAVSGQGLETIGKTLKPQEATQLDYKGGDPTELGYSVDFDAKRMADVLEAGRARDVHLGYTWLAALADMGMSYYSTKALVNTPSILQQIMGGAQAAADIASVYVAGKP